ncbi:MAG: DUF5050 domain-containing protein [Lachnospiraceae bacterium]|nr:DUF5050 domain-containing protein [Lachnospiraceae bacterium]
MNKKVRSILAVCLLVAAVAIFFLVDALNKRTLFSDSSSTGNTPANIYNDGLFCEKDGVIYFSNHDDDGTLYTMKPDLSDVEKLYSDKVRYLNADENYVYYSRINNLKETGSKGIFVFRNNGIYRLTKSGNDIKMLYMDPSGQSMLYKNRVYYQYYNEENGLNLHSVGIDGKGDEAITEDMTEPAGMTADWIYFSDPTDSRLYRMSLTDHAVSLFANAKVYMPVPSDLGIYYISVSDNYGIYRMGYGSSEPVKLVDGICSTFNLSNDGRYLFYQRDGSDDNGVHRYSLDTGDDVLLLSGDYKWLNVAADRLFFYSFDETQVYVYSPSTGVLPFSPGKDD